MTNDLQAGASTHATLTLCRIQSPVCACGQDLDICNGEHCPRCGALIES